jgi:hypothetical protein
MILRRNKLKRSNRLFCFRYRVLVFVTLGFFFGVSEVFAQTTPVNLTQPITVNAVVISRTVTPTPPPLPNPVNNNGVPLSTVETGTDATSFKGFAYPGSLVSVLKNGLVLNELPAYADGTFEIPVHNILPGTYTFSLRAKDSSGLLSSTVTYTIIIESRVITEVSGVIIPPTITTDKTEVKAGDTIVFSGKSVPNKEVSLTLFAKRGIIKTITSSASGAWSYTLSTSGLDLGDYNAKARTKIGTDYSLYSDTVLFTIGNVTKMRKSIKSLVNARCDLNNDSRVNLLDFSIMAFWYKRLGFPAKVDLNSDARVNLTDLSILAYCWTG